jgi:pyrrolidone-carboxylate peptidase
MVHALRTENLPVEPSSDAGPYICNYTLYRVLTGYAGRPDAPAAGFLHVPQAREFGAPHAAFGMDTIDRAVRAAAQAFANALSRVREPALA